MLVLVDIAMLIITEVTTDYSAGEVHGRWVDIIVWVVLVLFALEIGAKLVVLRPYLFVKDAYNIFDFVVVLLSLIFNVVSLVPGDSTFFVALRGSRTFYKIVRVTRAARSARYLWRVIRSGEVTARHIVGRNKARYIDLENNFDLDLAYINPKTPDGSKKPNNLIVMSVPASGRLALFRNPIWEVERFLNTFHKDSWRIYNCCPELPYRDIQGGAIIKYNIQDHSPPTMANFVDFLNDAGDFMRKGESQGKSNVLAVHCKGGKGRSGSLCCAWLLYSKECEDAESALNTFADSRTDENKQGKVQGVETPSQRRYIYQVDQLLKKQNLYFDTLKAVPDWAMKGNNKAQAKVMYPPETSVKIGSLKMTDFFLHSGEIVKRGSLAVVVKANDAFVSQSEPVLAEVLTNNPVFALNVEVGGDIQVSIYCVEEMEKQSFGLKSKEENVRCGNERGMLANFFFHSAFVGKEEFTVPIARIDKACKDKGKNYNMEKGKITLNFVEELPRFSV